MLPKDWKKSRKMYSGKIDEIIYARLEPGEDLQALWDICEQKDVKTGILLDATGSMQRVKVMRYPHEPVKGARGIDYVDIQGPLEVSARHHRDGVGARQGAETGAGALTGRRHWLRCRRLRGTRGSLLPRSYHGVELLADGLRAPYGGLTD